MDRKTVGGMSVAAVLHDFVVEEALPGTGIGAEAFWNGLAAILRDLHEGVLVCNAQHQILLYNQTAVDLLQLTGTLGLGRSLLHFLAAEPVIHTLERLTLRVREGRHLHHEHGTTAQFVGGTKDGGVLLGGRMSVILQEPDGTDEGPPAITGYVITLADATRELAALGQRDALLREATESFRSPIANLRAVVETMADSPELGAEDRAAFEQAMQESCNALSDKLERVAGEYRNIITGSWPMSDIHSANLINLVRHRTGSGRSYTVTPTGLPQWVHADSFSVVVLLDYLIEYVYALTAIGAYDLSATSEGKWVYLDIEWQGHRQLKDKLPQDVVRAALGKVFDSLYSTGERDKFRTRLERNANGGTDIFVTHRGMEEVYSSARRDSTVWQPRARDPELEAEFMRRMMVKLGVSQEQAKAALA